MITREKDPPNLEMPFGALDGFVTPTERFYVRCHFPIPKINEREWGLKIEGHVTRPLRLTMDELRELPAQQVTATVECAGNSRVFLVPKVKGVQWELGAVGNAEWTGVRLRDVLERADISDGAREIVFEGADSGTIAELPRPAGKVNFARSVPIEKAMQDVLLAWAMNGEPLTEAHGFPLRAIVPGWYGMASVKWLQRLIITDRPFHGYYQSIDYAYWRRDEDGPVLVPLAEMQVKAEIARPENNEVISANSHYHVRGAAWTAGAIVTRVEISFDGGKSWSDTRLDGNASENAWRLWEFEWKSPVPGNYTLMARATDSRGRVQSTERNFDANNYMISHCLPIAVEVRL
jgi:DMSO/TMAO reductase YedYZ molybdopterin-dependent catalytic subunit